MNSNVDTARVPFVNSERGREFQNGISKFLRDALDASVKEMIAPENVMRLRHGRTWTHSSDDSEPGQMQVHSAQKELGLAEVAQNNIAAFKDFLVDMAGQFRDELHKNMYSVVEDWGAETQAGQLGRILERDFAVPGPAQGRRAVGKCPAFPMQDLPLAAQPDYRRVARGKR